MPRRTHPLIRFTEYAAQTIEPQVGYHAPFTTDEAAALLAGCTPCELAARAALAAEPTVVEPDPTGLTDDGTLTWEGVLTIEGEMTGDGRMIEPGALRWDTLPIPLRSVFEDQSMGHAGAITTGFIDTIERRDGGIIWGTGRYDIASEYGREAARQVGEELTPGVSVDLDDVSFEIRVAADLLQEEQQIMEEGPAGAAEDNPVDEDGRVTVIAMNSDDEVMVTTSARIRAATGVAIPAFEGARIHLTQEDWRERLEHAPLVAAADAQPMIPGLVASGIPVDPPRAWFSDPHLTEPTRLTITDDGRIFGHLAEWGTCHRTHTAAGRCITPPFSSMNYGHFMTGTLRTSEGDLIPVGRITMDADHATTIERISAAAAKAHYENTGTVVADVAAGEDTHGIWIAGALRPGMSPAKMRALRSAVLSGDWREVGGGKAELVAALAVPVGGFPIAASGLVADGMMVALTAAGALPVTAPRGVLSDDDIDALRELASAIRNGTPLVSSTATTGATYIFNPSNETHPPVKVEPSAAAAALALRAKAASLAYRLGRVPVH